MTVTFAPGGNDPASSHFRSLGERPEREPVIVVVAMPADFVPRSKKKIDRGFFPFQDGGWDKPRRMDLVLLLETKQGVILSSPQEAAGIHIVERYEHRTFSRRPLKQLPSLAFSAARQDRVQEQHHELKTRER